MHVFFPLPKTVGTVVVLQVMQKPELKRAEDLRERRKAKPWESNFLLLQAAMPSSWGILGATVQEIHFKNQLFQALRKKAPPLK